MRICVPLLFVFVAWSPTIVQADDEQGAPWIQDWLVLPRSGRYGRIPVPRDPLLHTIVTGTFQTPRAGGSTPALDGAQRVWAAATTNEDGCRIGHLAVSRKTSAPSRPMTKPPKTDNSLRIALLQTTSDKAFPPSRSRHPMLSTHMLASLSSST